MQRETAEAEAFIKLRRAFILGVNRNGEDGQRSTRVQHTPHGVRGQ